jgi:GDP-D-mannose 3',5'-epimerase
MRPLTLAPRPARSAPDRAEAHGCSPPSEPPHFGALQLTCPSAAHNSTLQEEEFCDEFHLVDLRLFENCKKVVSGCDHAFHMAADMGGMGFIQSNHSVILYNNTMISYNFLEAARQAKVQR